MNKIASVSINSRLMVFVLSLLLMIAGYVVYTQLPVDAFPDVSPNLVQIFTETEGLAPEEVEKFVSFPVETAMNGLPGVREIRSVSNFGLSVVNVYFEDDMSIYFARQLVNERLAEAREGIPEGFGEPKMGPISTGMGQILFYYLEDESGSRTLEELRTIQDWMIKRSLQTVPGVTEILGVGGFEKQFHIIPRPEALLEYDISITELKEIVEANNLNVGAQFIEKNSEEYIINAHGLATGISDLENIVIKAESGTPVYLKNVAEVTTGPAIRRGIQTRNGEGEVVAGMVIKLIGTNSSSVIEQVEAKIAEINRSLPAGVKIVPYYEQRTIVKASVDTVSNALLQGIFFVAALLMIFLGSFRGSIVAALSIPFSIMFAFIGMGVFGISANLMSLGGLAIAIGMLVDGTIVIVENIDRHLRKSTEKSRLKIIGQAAGEMIRPIFFAVLVIIIVFLPLFTLQGVEGKTFRPLAYTLALAMLGSLIFALFIAPAISSVFMKKPKESSRFKDLYNSFEDWTFGIYRMLLTFLLSRKIIAIVLVVVLIILGGFSLTRLGSEFTPELEEGTVLLRLSLAPSVSLEESRRVALLVEKKLMNIQEIKGVVSRIGRGEIGAHTDPVNSVEMYLELQPKDKWRGDWKQEELEERIREDLGELPGVNKNFTQPIATSIDELLEGIRAELAIKLFGEDLDELRHTANEIAVAIEDVPGAADVQVEQVAGTPQLRIDINRSEIARFGLNVADVQNTIQAAVGGVEAGEIFEGTRRFDILLRYPEKDRFSLEAIQRIVIPAANGAKVLLSDVATLAEVVGPRQITRQNGQRFITVQCNVSGRDIGTFVREAQQHIADELEMPAGYSITWGGQYRLQQEANERFMVVIPITLLLIFVLIYSSLNSLKSTLLILLNIPLALVGGVVALWITGQNLSVPASVGFISLFGISIGNGLVMVSYIRSLIRGSNNLVETTIYGATMRLRPVLMTAWTTALGLLPLLFAAGTGSEVQRPLATVVIGGLISSTIVTLYVLPTLLPWFVEKALLKKEVKIPTELE